MLVLAVSLIFAALFLYSIGVWAERIGGRLRLWHVIIFWAGLVCDTIGTGAMGELAEGLFQPSFHAVTGILAIVLMLFHATWATIVIRQKNEALVTGFHKFSVVVWCIWMVPMVSGMINGIVK